MAVTVVRSHRPGATRLLLEDGDNDVAMTLPCSLRERGGFLSQSSGSDNNAEPMATSKNHMYVSIMIKGLWGRGVSTSY